jgi:hypothetical protein
MAVKQPEFISSEEEDNLKYKDLSNEMVQGPCAHLQLHETWETSTVVLDRPNVIIDRLNVISSGSDVYEDRCKIWFKGKSKFGRNVDCTY